MVEPNPVHALISYIDMTCEITPNANDDYPMPETLTSKDEFEKWHAEHFGITVETLQQRYKIERCECDILLCLGWIIKEVDYGRRELSV